MLRSSLLVLFFAAAAFMLSAAPASESRSDYMMTYSAQTFVLTRGKPLYNEWKAFIDQQNVGRRKLGLLNGPGLPYEVGRITITITSGTSPPSTLPDAPIEPPHEGPPVPLPANGTEGQTLIMTNQTTTIYQQWMYVFESRGGVWREFSYRGQACRRLKEGGNLCEP